jgi:zinc/manganese transport system substrate-binding protein
MRQLYRPLLSLITVSSLLLSAPIVQANPTPPIDVVASFSILANITEEIGGPLVNVTTLVGPDADSHVFNPSPADAKSLARAQVVVINGLGFEGWIDRLVKSSGFKGKLVVASNGVKPLDFKEETKSHAPEQKDSHDHGHKHSHKPKTDHGKHDHAKHDHGEVDPHAWQDLKNGKIYAENIRAALVAVLPAARDEINARTKRYIDQIEALDQDSRMRLSAVPAEQRRVVSSHDAFGYFAQAYGVEFFAAQGWSTDREVSAADMSTLIREIRKDKVHALFVENMSDPRLMQRIAEETGVRVGGKLYSDALSAPGTAADTYLKMFSSNVNTILQALEP